MFKESFKIYYTYMYNMYNTLIGLKQDIIKTVYNSSYKYCLIGLLRKRLRDVDIILFHRVINKYDNDKDILLYWKEFSNENIKDWGHIINNPEIITPRAKSRINDFQMYLNVKPMKILDIGGGNAEILAGFGNYLNINKDDLWLVDLKYYGDQKMLKRITFLESKINEKINLPDESFDLILLLQSLHHMSDLEFKLKEIHRLLKPNGLIFVREHDLDNIYTGYMIDIEHLLYDIVLSNKNFQDIKSEYIGTIYRSSSEWEQLFLNEKLKLIHKSPTIGKNNPTRYYNFVLQK
jgi:SAM-dependent methyltransferase